MKKLTITHTTTLLLALATSGICADSWDIAEGYSYTNNPNGPWSYGRKWTVGDTAMDLFTVTCGLPSCPPGTWFFGNWGNGAPALHASWTATGPSMWAKDNGNGYPCDRWTCPKTAKYNIRGNFYADDGRGVDSFVYVVINGSITYSNRIQNYPQSVSFTNDSVSLNQGDVVDFTIVWGGGVYSEYGSTGVSGMITEVAPELPRLDIRLSQVELCWQTATNAWYQLQYRSTLTTNQWTPLTGVWVVGDGTRYCTTDAIILGTPQRFYQLSVTNSAP